MKFIDLTGQRFERLIVIRLITKIPKPRYWVKCDCGNEKEACGQNLRSGNIRSCGCLAIDVTRQRSLTHGESNKTITPEYRSWIAMKGRCYDSNAPYYKNYGARGITICERWRNSYEAFLEDMGRRPSLKHTLERKDVNGNYEPGNCLWATIDVQSNNRRTNRRIEFNGKNLTLSQWGRETGFGKQRILARLNAGWTPERIITSPIDVTKRNNV